MYSIMRIPKYIWTWWDGPEMPRIVKLCIEQWKLKCPDYTVYVLNSSNVSNYIDKYIVDKINYFDKQQQKADLVRLAVTYKHGGIWMDSSIIIRKSLDWFVELGEKFDFVCYYTDCNTLKEYKNTSPMIENWMFGCIKGSPFVRDWLNEFIRVTTFPSIKDYVNDVKEKDVNPQMLSNSLEYHTAYFSAQYIMQYPKEKYKMYLIMSDNTAFELQTKTRWRFPKLTMGLLILGLSSNQPVTKIINSDRKALEFYGNYDSLFEKEVVDKVGK